MQGISDTPKPPYFAVIFTSRRAGNGAGYPETAEQMLDLASRQPGFLGVESVREGTLGITVSYWKDVPSIRTWKAQVDHQTAQKKGKEEWYQAYAVRVAKVERAYAFEKTP
jgi:heme-degrading monooxygenase HmoA